MMSPRVFEGADSISGLGDGPCPLLMSPCTADKENLTTWCGVRAISGVAPDHRHAARCPSLKRLNGCMCCQTGG